MYGFLSFSVGFLNVFFILYCHNCFLFFHTVGKSSILQKCKLPRGGWISCEYLKSKLLYYDITQLQDIHYSLRYGRVTITELWRKQNNAKCALGVFASGFSVWNDWSTHFIFYLFLNQKPWYVLQKSFGSDVACEWFAVNGLKHVKSTSMVLWRATWEGSNWYINLYTQPPGTDSLTCQIHAMFILGKPGCAECVCVCACVCARVCVLSGLLLWCSLGPLLLCGMWPTD